MSISKKNLIILLAIVAVICLVVSERSQNTSSNVEQVSREREIEERLSSMIETLDGVSRADVIVTLDSYESGKSSPKVRGVAIICHGKQKDEIKMKIVMIASTALGISSDKIFVSFS